MATQQQNEPPKVPLTIESGAHNPQPEPAQSLDLGDGLVIKLDNLGPMIVNKDGTLSRITNWAELSDIERKRIVRLLVKKRNLVRLNQQADAEGASEDDKLSALKQ